MTKKLPLKFDQVDPPSEFWVVYKPYALTPQIEEDLRDAIRSEEKGVAVELFRLFVVDWDVRDDRDPDAKLDLNDKEEVAKQLPTAILGWITEKVLEDSNPKKKKPLILRNGSSVVDGAGRVQAITPLV